MSKSTKQTSEDKQVKVYIAQLDDKERIAYDIAKDHLGSSFSIVKSIGFQKWKQKNNINI